MSGLSKGSADRSLIVPPKFGGKNISTMSAIENNNLRDVGLIKAVTTVKKLPVAGWATPGCRKKSYPDI